MRLEMIRLRLFPVILLLSTLVFAAPPGPEAAIKSDELRSHMLFLSDDLLEGRATATRGHEIATRYVAAQYSGMGLKPAGDNGTFFQTVHLRQAILQTDKSSFSLEINGKSEPQKLEDDWYSGGSSLR